jgi:hypothetical protein
VVSDLIEENPTTFAVYEMHVGDSLPSDWANQRRLFYDDISDGVPWFAYDGMFDAWWPQGGGTQGIANYEPNLILRQAIPTDVTIELDGVETGAQTYDVTAHVCVEEGGTGKTMRIYMVHALDHWPATPTYVRNTIRYGVTTEDVTVAAGDCADVTRTFAFDATSWAQQSDIKIVAWAQTPATSYPAEVHQAKVLGWPFPSVFADGFDSGGTEGWSFIAP